MYKSVWICILFSLILSCNQIEYGNSLKQSEIEYIKSLGLLEDTEEIKKFYSEHTNEIAGNFFTNKRLAKYWIDKGDSSKNVISSAFYGDIITIDTIYDAGLTYCPYLVVTKKDKSTFKVCVEGTKEEVKLFFEEAISNWKKAKE